MNTYFFYREGTHRTDILDVTDMPAAMDMARRTLAQSDLDRPYAEVLKVAYNPAATTEPKVLAIRPVRL